MARFFALIAAVLLSHTAWGLEKISAPTDPITTFQMEGEFDDVKFNLALAIAGKGLKVSGTLHISDMLTRTAKDTHMPPHPYAKAESLEFCSAVVTHLMSQAHPANMANCPLTINLYTLKAEPGLVFFGYRNPALLGHGEKAEQALIELLDAIIEEAAE